MASTGALGRLVVLGELQRTGLTESLTTQAVFSFFGQVPVARILLLPTHWTSALCPEDPMVDGSRHPAFDLKHTGSDYSPFDTPPKCPYVASSWSGQMAATFFEMRDRDSIYIIRRTGEDTRRFTVQVNSSPRRLVTVEVSLVGKIHANSGMISKELIEAEPIGEIFGDVETRITKGPGLKPGSPLSRALEARAEPGPTAGLSGLGAWASSLQGLSQALKPGLVQQKILAQAWAQAQASGLQALFGASGLGLQF
ncbi:hypothetical protein C8R43DRAFT_952905 [Mycena crocata]|nr:hypothetical protein C8R43DRAFT_952905 [Mycena crocata]